jgi:hypothetical protein
MAHPKKKLRAIQMPRTMMKSIAAGHGYGPPACDKWRYTDRP